jgi:hypothetical protein
MPYANVTRREVDDNAKPPVPASPGHGNKHDSAPDDASILGLVNRFTRWLMYRSWLPRKLTTEPLRHSPANEESESAREVKAERYRVFISYSHDDLKGPHCTTDYPADFNKRLLAMTQAHGLDDSAVFFDCDSLRLSTQNVPWDQTIARALKECDVFVLLVSVHSLRSKNCLPIELHHALNRKPAAEIVPVLLDNPTGWGETTVKRGDHRQRLDSFPVILPLDQQRPKPIGQWVDDKGPAWNQVCEHVRDLLDRPRSAQAVQMPEVATGTAGVASGIVGGDGRPPPELVPCFCDQTGSTSPFANDLVPWTEGLAEIDSQGRALVILIKGGFLDYLDKFYVRVEHEFLAPEAASKGLEIGAYRPLQNWPKPDPSKSQERLVAAVAASIDQALGLPRNRALSAAGSLNTDSLEKYIEKLPQILNLHIQMPDGDGNDVGATVQAMLKYIGRCPKPGVLGRILIVVYLENRPDLADEQLINLWGLAEFSRVAHVIESPPLTEFDHAAIEHWHFNQKIEDRFQIDFATLIRHLNANGGTGEPNVSKPGSEARQPGSSPITADPAGIGIPPIRMRLRTFVDIVKPLLVQKAIR